jgi:alpha-L-fucosidase
LNAKNFIIFFSFRYQDFAKSFTAELFDPAAWVELFVKSGARYIVPTTKHHDG